MMSADREEIRWKFQVLLENISQAIASLENERKTIDERYSKEANEQDKLRTKWFGGIGFLIVILTPLVAIGYLEQWYSFVIIAALVLGIIIWVWTNMSLQSKFLVFREIDDTYLIVIKDQLLPLRGAITTFALVENFTKEKTEFLIKYVSLYAISISYTLTKYLNERLGLDQLDQESFRKNFEFAKQSINEFKNSDLKLQVQPIEKFIKEFEKNEKSKS